MIHPRYGDLNAIARKTGGKCHICHKPAPLRKFGSPAHFGRSATTIDHLKCQSHGGTDNFGNLMLAHAGCNSSRGTRSVRAARMQWAGTPSKPWSTAATYTAVGAVSLGLGYAAGKYWSNKDQYGRPQFNWGAAAGTAVGTFGLFCLFRAFFR